MRRFAGSHAVAIAAAVVLSTLTGGASARENATSAFAVMAIDKCEVCTTDGDSIFCTEGSGYIYDAETPRTYVNYDARGDPIPGPYCWEGTFGAILQTQGNMTGGILGSQSWVDVNLECNGMNLYYRQCIIPADLATVLFVIGSLVFFCCASMFCVCCGLCKCRTDNEWQCCYITTCKRVRCWAPKSEVSTSIEDKAIARTLTGPADDDERDLESGTSQKKLSAQERLAIRRAKMMAESALGSQQPSSTTANPVVAASGSRAGLLKEGPRSP